MPGIWKLPLGYSDVKYTCLKLNEMTKKMRPDREEDQGQRTGHSDI